MVERKNEIDEVVKRYAKRAARVHSATYSMANPSVLLGVQERQRAVLSFLSRHEPKPFGEIQVLEVGCGNGGNLLELLRFGFSASNLVGNELLHERYATARLNLPQAIQLLEGDALKLPFKGESFDIVYQSTVFSSLLDMNFQSELAQKMWGWVRPGGAVLWYDFTYDNPNNPDVRGVTLARIRQLFPDGIIHAKRVTLAPPISRIVCKVNPVFYTLLNALPLLRTHLLCYIKKK